MSIRPALQHLCSLARVGRALLCLWGAPHLLGGVPIALPQDSAKAAAGAVSQDSAKKAAADTAQRRTPDQLDALVAPIALYPDDLLAQTLVASTYPLEIVQLQQWLAKHPGLKDKALVDSVAKQSWDPSIQSMAALPDVVKRLSDDIQWTTELGNAFLAQQSDVMDACQRMRKKAKDKGALETNEQQKVETKVVEQKQVIVVESANPEVIYVPSYSPTVVYGPPIYPYPPIYYPPYPAGAAFVSFGIGMMWGAAMWGGACCHAGWGHSNVNINVNNNFNRASHYNGGRGGNWQHNPQHRGGAPYADQRTADKFGGSNRGAGVSDRAAGTGQGQRGAGVSDRSAGGAQGQRAGVNDRAAGAGGGPRAGGGDQIGSHNIPRDAGGGGGFSGSGGFGGSGGFDGGSARASSSRGASSMGARGGSRGGGGRRR
ncbi:MAG TPA: DUF3300 domain-containing protein [Gemmatimonadales bacterium]|nr:DUF3300 domain-containing protein [Gemmatimonadales bacterium]